MDFTLTVQGIDIVCFKHDANGRGKFFELSASAYTVDQISGKSGNSFCHN